MTKEMSKGTTARTVQGSPVGVCGRQKLGRQGAVKDVTIEDGRTDENGNRVRAVTEREVIGETMRILKPRLAGSGSLRGRCDEEVLEIQTGDQYEVVWRV